MSLRIFTLNGVSAIISSKILDFLFKQKFIREFNDKISNTRIKSFFERKFIFGIRWKLILTYLFISIGPLLLCALIILNSLDTSFSEKSSGDYLRKANVWASEINEDYFFKESERSTFNSSLDVELEKEGNLYRLFIFDTKCSILYDSNKRATGKTYVVPEVLLALSKKPTWEVYDDTQTIYATSTIMENEKVNGAVLIVASVSDNFDMLSEITRNLFLIIGLVGVVVSILVYFNARIMISPLKNFLDAVERISEGRLDERIDPKGHDEFTMLAEAFNHMTDQLERVEKTRDEFVSNVSHELKTPLSSMKILSDAILIQEGVDISLYKEFLQDINSEIDRMTDIINDLLNVVKLDQGETGLNIEENIDLYKLVTDILKRLFPLAEQKQIKITLNEVKQKIMVDMDQVKMTLAISNLIENAIKYTNPEGIVKISLEQDHMHAFVSVQDSGIGISEEDQNKVFDRFYRVDKTRDRETGGTGLGLSITHSTVLLHNGSIKLTSKLDEGSTFLIRIPLSNQNISDGSKKISKSGA